MKYSISNYNQIIQRLKANKRAVNDFENCTKYKLVCKILKSTYFFNNPSQTSTSTYSEIEVTQWKMDL